MNLMALLTNISDLLKSLWVMLQNPPLFFRGDFFLAEPEQKETVAALLPEINVFVLERAHVGICVRAGSEPDTGRTPAIVLP